MAQLIWISNWKENTDSDAAENRTYGPSMICTLADLEYFVLHLLRRFCICPIFILKTEPEEKRKYDCSKRIEVRTLSFGLALYWYLSISIEQRFPSLVLHGRWHVDNK